MKRLLWGRSARRDLLGIKDYYGEIDRDIAVRLLERIEKAPLVLLAYPELGSPTRMRGLRKWSVKRTPFVLLYRVVADEVQVRRVIDARSNISRILR